MQRNDLRTRDATSERGPEQPGSACGPKAVVDDAGLYAGFAVPEGDVGELVC